MMLYFLIYEPDFWTRRALASYFDVSIDTIKNGMADIRKVGFEVVCSGYPDYTYSIKVGDKLKVLYQ